MKLSRICTLFCCALIAIISTNVEAQQFSGQQQTAAQQQAAQQQAQLQQERARNQRLYEEQQRRASSGFDQNQQQGGQAQNGQAQTDQQFPPLGQANARAIAPVQPFPQLDEKHLAYIDQLLDIWQESSGQVKQYTCDFQRWDYDPINCNYRNPGDNRLAASSIARGAVRYAKPDKGMFETNKVWDFAGPPEEAGGQPNYKEREQSSNHEKWICTGDSIYEFDFENKVLYGMDIPQDMQGAGLANSPLPFLFGVEKQIIKDRYWVRMITPAGVENEFWLEAWPKRIDDARNYQKIEIILAREDFLPKTLHIYATNYDEVKNPMSRVFEFGNRRVNSQLDKLKNFLGIFVKPQTPINWRFVDRKALADQTAAQQQPPINVGQNPNQDSTKQLQPRR